MSTRPSIPHPVKRALRQEAGFGCCKCGFPIYDYQHIIPYSIEEHFRVEDMMILCPNHHREATLGAMPEEEQRRYKANPYNRQRGIAEGTLRTFQPSLAVAVASDYFFGDGTFLEVDDVPLIQLHTGLESTVELSVELRNRDDDLLALIEHNEWVIGDPLPWDFEFHPRRIRDQRGLPPRPHGLAGRDDGQFAGGII